MSQEKSPLLAGVQAVIPLVLGYFPIAFSFGVAATRTGLTPLEAFSLSLIVFAGAAQFLAIALLASGAPVLVAAMTLAAMNLRHVLYGPTLLQRAGTHRATRLGWLWAFALTDEVFGAALGALAKGQRFSEGFMIVLGFGAYAAALFAKWVMPAGAVFGFVAVEPERAAGAGHSYSGGGDCAGHVVWVGHAGPVCGHDRGCRGWAVWAKGGKPCGLMCCNWR